VVLLLVLVLGWAAPAGAQTGERIPSYHVDLRVTPDGDLEVHETIVYDFGANERHGIFRDIPTRFPFDDRHDRVYPLSGVSIGGSPGTPVQFTVEEAANQTRFKIGDPNRTITGEHTYDISYTVGGSLNGFEDHDELFWNAIGTEWPVPIEQATVAVTAPGDVTQVICFAGPFESRLPCAAANQSGDEATFEQAQLGAHDALTVVVGFPKGLVPPPAPILEEKWNFQHAFQLTPMTGGMSGGLLAAVVAGVAWLTYRTGRDRRFVGSHVDVAFGNATGEEEAMPFGERNGEVPVEFVPPDGLRPGQVGTLIDERANTLDVTATIIDLAVRGYLRIEEIPKDGWFGSQVWRLVRLRDSTGLQPYEALLFERLFAGRGDAVLLSSLKDTFAKDLGQVQDALYKDVVHNGWFRERPDHTRAKWVAIGVAALVVGALATAVVAATTSYGLVPVPLVLAGILLLVFAGKMPSRTAKGTGTLRRVLGFKRFIDESEAERAKFAEQQHLFTEYLPYAVVFGATEKWAKAFTGLDGGLPATPFYVSPRPFNGFMFATAMTDFSTTAAGTLVSTPSSSGSSGFGGGGFSGGGGGGGGGGSW
jgi:uncharacterized membrane protein YgcG